MTSLEIKLNSASYEFVRYHVNGNVALEYFPDTPTTWSRVAKVFSSDGKIVAIARMVDINFVSLAEIEQEFDIAAIAGIKELGPLVLASQADLGLMVMRYLSPQANTVSTFQKLTDFCERLRKFHNIRLSKPPDLQRRKLRALGDRMTMCIASRILPEHYGIAYELLMETLVLLADHFSTQPMLVHGDLNPTNLIWSAYRGWLIDFDHVGWGDPLTDIATLALALKLASPQEEVLLSKYFGRTTSPAERSAFLLHKLSILLKYGLDIASMRYDPDAISDNKLELCKPEPFLLLTEEKIPLASRMEHLSDGFLFASVMMLKNDVNIHKLVRFFPALRQSPFSKLAEQWIQTKSSFKDYTC